MSQASRHGNRVPLSASQRPAAGHPMTCNNCRKPLSTTVFVVSCNCVFCEECTFNHFQESPNCPRCNKVLTEKDFTELVVANPNVSSSHTCLQSMFTKLSSKSPTLALQDACANLMKQNDEIRACQKFLMKQFLMETSRQNGKFAHANKLIVKLRQENLSLKQAQNSEKMLHEQTAEKLQQQLHSMTQQLHSTEQKLTEREEQVMQFRRIHESNGRKEPSSGGARRVSGVGMPQGSSQGPPRPPLPGFMKQRDAQERAKQRQLETPQRRGPIMGCNSNSYRPASHSGGYNPKHIQTPQGRYAGNGSISPLGIRNITASTPFSFSGGQKRRRSSSSGASPSQAFSSNPSGAYSRSQSPSSAFQNHSYAPRRQY